MTKSAEELRNYKRQWRRDNPDKVRVQNQRVYEKRKKNGYAKDRAKRQPLKTAWHRYKSNAKTTGRDFALTQEQFFMLCQDRCHYCGALPLNGIDRLDNAAGYTVTNCVPCCTRDNFGKGPRTTEQEYIEQCKRVAKWNT
jgi:hypothetical protein